MNHATKRLMCICNIPPPSTPIQSGQVSIPQGHASFNISIPLSITLSHPKRGSGSSMITSEKMEFPPGPQSYGRNEEFQSDFNTFLVLFTIFCAKASLVNEAKLEYLVETTWPPQAKIGFLTSRPSEVWIFSHQRSLYFPQFIYHLRIRNGLWKR